MAKAKRPPQTKKKLGGPRISEGGPRKAKADAVTDVQDRLTNSSAVLLTDYRGMTVGELAELRANLRDAGADYKVYKNTLATIAARNLGLEHLVEFFEGPTAFTFASGDPVIAAKRLSDFAKKVPTLVLKGGLFEGKILSAKDVGALGALESREVMLAKIAGMFLSPIQQLANLFAAPLNQLGAVLAQLRDKMPGEAAPAEEAAPTAEPEAAAESAPAAEAAPAPDLVGEESTATEAAAPAGEAPETPEPEAAAPEGSSDSPSDPSAAQE